MPIFATLITDVHLKGVLIYFHHLFCFYMLPKNDEVKKNLLALLETKSKQVPLQESNRWTENWLRYKPAPILPNCFLISNILLKGFLDHKEADLVVAFLGLEKKELQYPGYLHLFLFPALQNGPKEGDFTLVKDDKPIILCHPSFDPILKSTLTASQRNYVEDFQIDSAITVEKAREWTQNWYEYSNENGLNFPQYIVYTKREVNEMATVPGSDYVRVAFTYKPTGNTADPYLLDFVFFASTMTPDAEFTAMNVLRPNAEGGTDLGCICPPDTCCGCIECKGSDRIKACLDNTAH